jgi:hypothetical protein
MFSPIRETAHAASNVAESLVLWSPIISDLHAQTQGLWIKRESWYVGFHLTSISRNRVYSHKGEAEDLINMDCAKLLKTLERRPETQIR